MTLGDKNLLSKRKGVTMKADAGRLSFVKNEIFADSDMLRKVKATMWEKIFSVKRLCPQQVSKNRVETGKGGDGIPRESQMDSNVGNSLPGTRAVRLSMGERHRTSVILSLKARGT
jgi:hypothetical protein